MNIVHTMTSHKRYGVSKHEWMDCLFNSLFNWTTKKTLKLNVTGILGESTNKQWILLTKDLGPPLLTWFNFNPSMNK